MKQIFWLISLALIASCTENDGTVGDDILGADKLNIKYVEDSNLSIENQKDLAADLSSVSVALLGTLNDDVFGKTNVGSAFQLRLLNKYTFKEPTADSVKLFLTYKNYYGADTSLHQTAKVYMLKGDLNYEEKYNAQFDIKSIMGEEVGSTSFNKNLISDTVYLKSVVNTEKDSVINNIKQVDTILKYLTILLDKEKVGQYILDAPEANFSSSSAFLDYFKGLYVKTEDVSDTNKGSIYGFNAYASFMRIYYKDKTSDDTSEKQKNRVFSLPITDNSARLNYPTFEQKENIFTSTDSIYLQGLHGTKTKIKIPSLATWKDSTKVTVNNAKLVFKIAVDTVQAEQYPLPFRLELTAVDKDGERQNLRHTYITGSAAANGILNVLDSTYTFYMPEYLQSIIEGKISHEYFELSTAIIEQRVSQKGVSNYPGDAKNSPTRVILHNSGNHKPKLEVTYTKY